MGLQPVTLFHLPDDNDDRFPGSQRSPLPDPATLALDKEIDNLINAGRILQNSKTLAESSVPVGEILLLQIELLLL
ncbi:unnamed protein product [Urochloa humidicola]